MCLRVNGNVTGPQVKNRWGRAECSALIPYRQHFQEGQLRHTTNILFFWQRGPGSQCLLLLRLRLGPERITWASRNQECGCNLAFPNLLLFLFLIAVLNK